MAKETKMQRTNSAMAPGAFKGKGSWSRSDMAGQYKGNHSDINWNDGSKPEFKEIIKKDGKTTYKF